MKVVNTTDSVIYYGQNLRVNPPFFEVWTFPVFLFPHGTFLLKLIEFNLFDKTTPRVFLYSMKIFLLDKIWFGIFEVVFVRCSELGLFYFLVYVFVVFNKKSFERIRCEFGGVENFEISCLVCLFTFNGN